MNTCGSVTRKICHRLPISPLEDDAISNNLFRLQLIIGRNWCSICVQSIERPTSRVRQSQWHANKSSEHAHVCTHMHTLRATFNSIKLYTPCVPENLKKTNSMNWTQKQHKYITIKTPNTMRMLLSLYQLAYISVPTMSNGDSETFVGCSEFGIQYKHMERENEEK